MGVNREPKGILIAQPSCLAEVPSGGHGSRLISACLVEFLTTRMSFPPGGAGFAGVPKVAPGGIYAADASSQTIGTTGANAAAQTAPGNPFTLEGDLRFPLESMRNTSTFPRDYPGSYDEFRQILVKI